MCMKFRLLHIVPVFLVLALASCQKQEYKTLEDGVIVNVKQPVKGGPQKVRLTVMSDRIIRVSATPDKVFHDRNSLIILPDAAQQTGFAVRNSKDEVELQTSGMSAIVRKSDGRVRFIDAGGNRLSNESEPAMFTPIEVDGTYGYSTVNRFDTSDDEGLYPAPCQS